MTLSKTNKEAADKAVSFFYSDNWDIYPEFEAIKALYEWSENFQGADPFGLYLDLIGYSQEYYGCSIFSITPADFQHLLGYKELCLLGDALLVFKNNGYEPVYKYINHLSQGGDEKEND